MLCMSDITEPSQSSMPGTARPVRDTADAYVNELAVLNPILATSLGLPFGQD
jgi:hypothetical protein